MLSVAAIIAHLVLAVALVGLWVRFRVTERPFHFGILDMYGVTLGLTPAVLISALWVSSHNESGGLWGPLLCVAGVYSYQLGGAAVAVMLRTPESASNRRQPLDIVLGALWGAACYGAALFVSVGVAIFLIMIAKP